MQFGTDITTLAMTIAGILIALSVHEAMHAFTGHKLGDDTALEHGRVSFNPLSHIDPFATVVLPIATLLIFGVPILAAKPVPFNPNNVKWGEYGAALIALAGPLSNLAMAIIGALLFRLVGTPGFVTDFLGIFTALNISIMVFNLVPIPPLDGSRVLFAVAPEAVQRVMVQIESVGIMIVFALVLAVPQFGTILISIGNSILRFLL